MDPKVVGNIIDMPNENFVKEAPLTATHGKVHDCLWMTMDFSKWGKLVIQMDNYINKFLEEAKYDITGTTTTPK